MFNIRIFVIAVNNRMFLPNVNVFKYCYKYIRFLLDQISLVIFNVPFFDSIVSF